MKKAFKFTPTCMDDHKMLAAIPHFNKIFTTIMTHYWRIHILNLKGMWFVMMMIVLT